MLQRRIDLIYCGQCNKRLNEIAIQVGMLFGERLPINCKPTCDVYFADQDWKNPNLVEYKKAIVEKGVKVCTVLDWERYEQKTEVFQWIEELAPLVGRLVVIPKVNGTIGEIPTSFNGTEIILGYSVPTKYGATLVPVEEFGNRPVHLLGGSPQKQLDLYDKMNVVSIDCNYIAMKATKFCEFWTNKKGYTRSWVAMKDVLGARINDSIYTSFMLSCVNLVEAWNKKVGGLYYDI